MYQTPKNKERNRTQALSRQTLAPAERSRSGERLLSLRQASLVQASSFRLGEGSKDGNSSLCVPSFRRDLLTWARWTLAQNRSYSPKRQLAQTSWASHC